MPESGSVARPPANRLLDALSPDDYERVAPHLERLAMPLKTETMRLGAPVEHVYFPLGGVHSMTALMLSGAQVEIGVIGAEGVVGASEALTQTPALNHCFVQLEGAALRMSADAFRAAFWSSRALAGLVLGFQHAFGIQVAQTAACNRLHSVEERLARWLLLSHDRAASDRLLLTHEFLSIMLGTTRPTITHTLGVLTSEGAVVHGWGTVTIADREQLEALSCECYDIVAGLYRRLYRAAAS
jgi:CRP-like cAMP-binding protein